MSLHLQPHERKASVRPALRQAAKPVIESLENRVLLSGGSGAWTGLEAVIARHGHARPVAFASSRPAQTLTGGYPADYPRNSPTDIMPAGIIRGASAAPIGYSVSQIRHLYRQDQLDPAFDPNFPL